MLIIVPIYKDCDKTDYSNYRGISIFSSTYTILSSILLSRLTPCAEEIIEKHQSGFRRNRAITNHLLCLRQILEKKWGKNEAVHQVFIDVKNTYHLLRRGIVYNILF
jgi:hypothetical protein